MYKHLAQTLHYIHHQPRLVCSIPRLSPPHTSFFLLLVDITSRATRPPVNMFVFTDRAGFDVIKASRLENTERRIPRCGASLRRRDLYLLHSEKQAKVKAAYEPTLSTSCGAVVKHPVGSKPEWNVGMTGVRAAAPAADVWMTTERGRR